ncbi:hypothetical protein ACFOTA_06860 [Chitinophaga sp. GCM10012297]|uniref:Uncharacterized protein n=1 Tax=Chitinophaga chungangae TaxID=2821488 RepID=A0ABS3YB75_9BACT|nr:zinc finger-like domain-containing protein [Chitinophaga chungangae]MBO9151919.1 hypothetical protein [Chitinophaga chungangae]
MNLRTVDIKRILKERPNAAIVDEGKRMNKKLAVHIAGIGMSTYLEKINTFENDDQKAIRQKYARSNVDLFERIGRPIDEVFSARGGSVYYNLPKSDEPVFRDYLGEVEWGYSLRKWMDHIARPAYLMDPMGLIFIEVNAKGEAYPTHKSIAGVYDYQLNGRRLDYVIFNTEKKNIFRIVDDSFDRLYKYEGDTLSIVPNSTFPNYFGHVPARVVSDIIKPGMNVFASPFWAIVELGDEFLREGSIKSVFKLMHGFPKYWQLTTTCSECQGVGEKNGETCKTCKGTGKKLRHDVADSINVPIPKQGDPKITPDVAGYVTPDIDGWAKMTEELKLLEDLMNQTVWGTHQREDADNNTATGRFIDTQPVIRRLSKFSEWGEDIEKFVTQELGTFYFPKSFKGCSVNYGRRYLVESPDTIWEKYINARTSGAPQSSLDELLRDYYYTKYSNDSLELQKHLRLMKLEPFVHLSINEAKNVAMGTPDYKMKLYFTEWLGTQHETILLFAKLEELRTSLREYADTKEDMVIEKEKTFVH